MDHSGARRVRDGAIAVLLLGLSFPVAAQMPYAGEQDALVVSDVVVTGTRVPTAPTRLSAAATVLTREDMRRTPFQNGTQVDDLDAPLQVTPVSEARFLKLVPLVGG